ncbi:MAG: AAA family ATPase [Cyanobacteriota bacterium]|nr:AAA family ATPase [Cyanobacteriota bacterium]
MKIKNELSNYQIGEKIYEGTRTVVYRGASTRDKKPVVIKAPKNEYPSFNELLQFSNQYAIALNLKLPNTVKPIALEPYRNGYALIMEDVGGVSLAEYIKTKPLELNEYLAIAISMAQILEQLYQKRIVHKDIKPSNILINPENKQIFLIDFSIASLLPKERQEIENINTLEGTLAYISPEQTGRMNRGIDYRTDFYSLGVTLYELLAGQLPFPANDPMELVHSHIAREPIPPTQINPQIPPVLGDIALKLMAKIPENRYQSASGLGFDLEICRQQWETKGSIDRFPLAQKDISDRFSIPEKLYGREKEVKNLLATFDRVAKGSREAVLVAGFSGIGKTATVNEVRKPILLHRGYFIKGKFDQFGRNIPFSALVQAFSELMRQLLAEGSVPLRQWKAKILAAVGERGQAIIDVIPELELLIGKQPPLAELSPTAAENRFNLLFQKFIRVFSDASHPLVIFLDDLQWADSASLKLMQLLMNDAEVGHFLLIGAYRDNEVSPTHPLMLALEEMENLGATFARISLAPLDKASVNASIADTLFTSEERANPLTELVYQKTKGNPFYLTQFLKYLHQEGLIEFSLDNSCWQCDIARVKALSLSDDVVEFMADRLKKFPSATREIIELAACIGSQFDLETLAIVYEKSFAQAATSLWPSLQHGLIVPTNEIYKFYQQIEEIPQQNKDRIVRQESYQLPKYKFLHDRVQQAAYFLIPESNKRATHLKIGELLLSHTPAEKLDENIFEIVNQLNQGVDLIASQNFREELAQLNLTAGRKALASTAYGAAAKYLTVGLELLPPDRWEILYDLTLNLHVSAVEAEYLNTNFDRAAALSEIVLERSQNLLDSLKVYELKVQMYMVRVQINLALETGLSALELLGVSLEEEAPNNLDVNELINLPPMSDRHQQVAMRILNSLLHPAYASNPSLYQKIMFTMLRISRKYGNCVHSILGYVLYGIFLCSEMEIELGYRYGQLSLSLLEKLENTRAIAGDVLTGLNGQVNHWKESLQATFDPLKEAINLLLEDGNIEVTGYAVSLWCMHSLFQGINLENVAKISGEYVDLMQELKQDYCIAFPQIIGQAALNLLGKAGDNLVLNGTTFNETKSKPVFEKINHPVALFHLYLAKAMLCYILKEPEMAVENAKNAEKYKASCSGMYGVALNNFYYSLGLLASFSNAKMKQQKEILKQVAILQETMKIWAKFAPTNFQHKYELVEAETVRIFGDKWEACELYDRAIESARNNGFLHEEALANEVAAEFYLANNREKVAVTYLTEAYYGYARWGAKVKVKQLEKRYPQLLAVILNRQEERSSLDKSINYTIANTVTSTGSNINALLDLSSVIEASRALSETLELEELLSSLIRVAIENVGASKSVLILPQGGNLAIAAIASGDSTTLQPSHPLAESLEVPVGIINLVNATRQTRVIDDAMADTFSMADPYTNEKQPKSIVCTPLLHQGELMGILYLENNLAKAAFSSDRLEILEIITAQAAISLANANIYASLEEKVEERTRELNDKNLRLAETIKEVKRTQTQLIQTEKMSSLGQVVAGVAHEINNPVSFIYGNIDCARDYVRDLLRLINVYQKEYPNPTPLVEETISDIELDFLREDLEKLLISMKTGSERISKIVQSLRVFSRLDEAEKKPVDIEEGIDSNLLIIQNKLEANKNRPPIEVVKEYGNLPPVNCYASEINQVFLNIISNAIYALDEAWKSGEKSEASPVITVRTQRSEDQSVIISIADNGMGISKEVRKKIFDPFFTTKPVGSGTGLGLSVAHSIIVEKHRGNLSCNSTPGKGTEFAIEIPIN